MDIEIGNAVKKHCKLTDMELSRFAQIVDNKSHYPSGRTEKDMKISLKKINALLSYGYLKVTGFCYTNNGKKREDLYKTTL